MREVTTQEWPSLLQSAADKNQAVVALFTAPW